MDTPAKNDTSRQFSSAPLRAFARRHRIAASLVAIAVVAAASAPIAVQAAKSTDTSNAQPSVKPQSSNQAGTMRDTDSQYESRETMNTSQPGNGGSNQSSTNVTVNGQSIEVPANGSYHKSIDDGNGHTEVNVDSHHSSTGDSNSSTNNSSVKINVHSESHSESSN